MRTFYIGISGKVSAFLVLFAFLVASGLSSCKARDPQATLQSQTSDHDTGISVPDLRYIADAMLAIESEIRPSVDAVVVNDHRPSGTVEDTTTGLALAGGSRPHAGARVAQQSVIASKFLRKLDNTSSQERVNFEGITDHNDPVQLNLAIHGGTNGTNNIYFGLINFKGKHRPVFFKPRTYGDSEGWNNPQAEATINDVYQNLGGERVFGFRRPDVFYIKNRGRPYANHYGQDIWEGVAITHAAEDSRPISDLRTFLQRDGKARSTVRVKTDAGEIDAELTPEMQAKIVKAVQNDQILRYVVGDPDGHYKQYLVSYKYNPRTRKVDELDVQSLDYGASGLLAVKSPEQVAGAINNQQMSRLSALRNRGVSLRSGPDDQEFSIGLPEKLDADLRRKFEALYDSIDAYRLDNGTGSSINSTWHAQVRARISKLLAHYAD